MATIFDYHNSKRELKDEEITELIRGDRSYLLRAGESCVLRDEERLGLQSLNGSIVSLMLYDDVSLVKALANIYISDLFDSDSVVDFMNTTIENMEELGADRDILKAKIAGGANLGLGNRYSTDNIEIVEQFCNENGIDIITEKTLGSMPMVILLGDRFHTLIRTINNPIIASRINRRESILYDIDFVEEKIDNPNTLDDGFDFDEIIDLSAID